MSKFCNDTKLLWAFKRIEHLYNIFMFQLSEDLHHLNNLYEKIETAQVELQQTVKSRWNRNIWHKLNWERLDKITELHNHSVSEKSKEIFFEPHYVNLASRTGVFTSKNTKKVSSTRIPQFPALSCECPSRFSHVSE